MDADHPSTGVLFPRRITIESAASKNMRELDQPVECVNLVCKPISEPNERSIYSLTANCCPNVVG